MRVANWHAKEIFTGIMADALQAANDVMDDVVIAAKGKCPVGTVTREGKWSSAKVSFTPKTGANKGKLVSFSTDKRWTGRAPGDLKGTIRRVTKPARPGNIRVYAGSFKIDWAHMVEYGTMKFPAHPFLRPTFNGIKNSIVPKIQKKVSG